MFLFDFAINFYCSYIFLGSIFDSRIILIILSLICSHLLIILNSIFVGVFGFGLLIIFSPLETMFYKLLMRNEKPYTESYERKICISETLMKIPFLISDILFYYIIIYIILENVYYNYLFENYHLILSIAFGIVGTLSYGEYKKMKYKYKNKL